MIWQKFLSPLHLAKTQTLYIHKLTEIIIISKNTDLIFVAFEIVVSSLKDLNNSQKFLIIGFIIGLNRDRFSRKKGY